MLWSDNSVTRSNNKKRAILRTNTKQRIQNTNIFLSRDSYLESAKECLVRTNIFIVCLWIGNLSNFFCIYITIWSSQSCHSSRFQINFFPFSYLFFDNSFSLYFQHKSKIYKILYFPNLVSSILIGLLRGSLFHINSQNSKENYVFEIKSSFEQSNTIVCSSASIENLECDNRNYGKRIGIFT